MHLMIYNLIHSRCQESATVTDKKLYLTPVRTVDIIRLVEFDCQRACLRGSAEQPGCALLYILDALLHTVQDCRPRYILQGPRQSPEINKTGHLNIFRSPSDLRFGLSYPKSTQNSKKSSLISSRKGNPVPLN